MASCALAVTAYHDTSLSYCGDHRRPAARPTQHVQYKALWFKHMFMLCWSLNANFQVELHIMFSRWFQSLHRKIGQAYSGLRLSWAAPHWACVLMDPVSQWLCLSFKHEVIRNKPGQLSCHIEFWTYRVAVRAALSKAWSRANKEVPERGILKLHMLHHRAPRKSCAELVEMSVKDPATACKLSQIIARKRKPWYDVWSYATPSLWEGPN